METMKEMRSFCQEITEQEGFIFYDLVSGSSKKRGRFLRIFIDHKERPITVEDCSQVSKVLRFLLNAKSLLNVEAYDLEVSSPGLDRMLKEVWHYEKVVGKMIRLHVKKAYKSHYKSANMLFRGILRKVNQEGVFLDFQNGDQFFAFTHIQKANVSLGSEVLKQIKPKVMSKRESRRVKKEERGLKLKQERKLKEVEHGG